MKIFTTEGIETLSQEDFDDLPVDKDKQFPWLEERGWFKCGNVLGLLIFDKADSDWSYVVLMKTNDDGKYRAVDLEVSHRSAEEALAVLFQKMRSQQ